MAAVDLSEDEIRKVEDRVRTQMNEKLKGPMDITFQWMDVIQPDANGKLRLIVNQMAR